MNRESLLLETALLLVESLTPDQTNCASLYVSLNLSGFQTIAETATAIN